jgi:hypothetical protein
VSLAATGDELEALAVPLACLKIYFGVSNRSCRTYGESSGIGRYSASSNGLVTTIDPDG